ncbi:MAG TPA: carboxypeptidase-like regulatory domain-containing protein [Pyrinomonadaceae bacterium]|nr:carboxypeptidase-like regulatory domain-containing protein [Pyrinomonadaceae bacterium]
MKNFDVNKLRIATPCHFNWENMSGDERVRFCQSCKLNVYNISEMTTAEVTNLITKTEGRICGRIYRRSDGTVLTKDCPVGVRAQVKRVTKFAGAVFASIIGLFSVAFSQTDKKKDETCKIVSQGKVVRDKSKSELVSVKGTVMDLNGAVVPGVKISLKNTATKKEMTSESNDEGDFKFKDVSDGLYEISFVSNGFKTYKIEKLQFNKNESLNFEISLQSSGNVEVGVIISEPLIDTTSSGLTTRISGEMIRKLPIPKK